MRYVPSIGLAAFLLIGVGWRAWRHRRRHGSWGIALFRSRDPWQVFRDSLLILLFLVVGAQALAFAVRPEIVARAFLLAPRDAAGIAALVAGIVLTVQAQVDLGASWRVGIDEGARTGLVTRGVYTLSRNPIFMGLLPALAGLTLLMPTWLSFLALAASVAGIRRQVLAEEAYLLRTYGDAYRDYARRVGRFLPGLGRLR